MYKEEMMCSRSLSPSVTNGTRNARFPARSGSSFRSSKTRARVGLGLVVSSVLLWANPGEAAEQSIIKHPGDHPRYSVEIEPHGVAAIISPLWDNGFGLGARFSIPLVDNGFIPSINNNVAIGFGLDWIHYAGCWRGWNYRVYNYACQPLNAFYMPVVLQWNFFFSTHFSAFAEPGFGIRYADWPYGCSYYEGNGQVRYADCGPYHGSHFDFDPFIFAVGGRYHITERVSLTGRIGYPYFSFGVSFFP